MQNTETNKRISTPYRVRRWSRKPVSFMSERISGSHKSQKKGVEFILIYELRYGDVVEQGDDLAKLKVRARRTSLPWTICKIEINTRVNDAMKEIELFGSDGVEALMKDVAKGIPLTRLSVKYHTSAPTLSKYITRYRNTHESLK